MWENQTETESWNLGTDGGPSWFWGRTRLTENVAHSLNDAVFKLFLLLPAVK